MNLEDNRRMYCFVCQSVFFVLCFAVTLYAVILSILKHSWNDKFVCGVTDSVFRKIK